MSTRPVKKSHNPNKRLVIKTTETERAAGQPYATEAEGYRGDAAKPPEGSDRSAGETRRPTRHER